MPRQPDEPPSSHKTRSPKCRLARHPSWSLCSPPALRALRVKTYYSKDRYLDASNSPAKRVDHCCSSLSALRDCRLSLNFELRRFSIPVFIKPFPKANATRLRFSCLPGGSRPQADRQTKDDHRPQMPGPHKRRSRHLTEKRLYRGLIYKP